MFSACSSDLIRGFGVQDVRFGGPTEICFGRGGGGGGDGLGKVLPKETLEIDLGITTMTNGATLVDALAIPCLLRTDWTG